jgi:G3E family GTPase
MGTSLIPTSVIGGYLGAGKTTLINHWLRTAQGVRIAVLVNEFGALPIDADLVESADENVISITGGCVCCSYGSDLLGALMDLPKLGTVPEQVLIEASGVALPGAIADAVGLLPEYQVDAIWVLADAETIEAQAKDRYIGDTIERQLAAADIVLLTKADLVDNAALEKTQHWIEGSTNGARILRSAQANIPTTVAFTAHVDSRRTSGPSANTHHASDEYDSFVVPLPGRYDVNGLAQAIASPELGLLRAKGFVNGFSDANAQHGQGRYIIQSVGRRWSCEPATSKPGTPGPETPGLATRELESEGLVCIGLRNLIERDAVIEVVERHRCSST